MTITIEPCCVLEWAELISNTVKCYAYFTLWCSTKPFFDSFPFFLVFYLFNWFFGSVDQGEKRMPPVEKTPNLELQVIFLHYSTVSGQVWSFNVLWNYRVYLKGEVLRVVWLCEISENTPIPLLDGLHGNCRVSTGHNWLYVLFAREHSC